MMFFADDDVTFQATFCDFHRLISGEFENTGPFHKTFSLKQTFLTKDSMLWWGIHAWNAHHKKMHQTLSAGGFNARVYRLRTPRQVNYLVEHAVLRVPASATIPE